MKINYEKLTAKIFFFCSCKYAGLAYCDALHVQLSQMKHTAQDGLLVPCLQGYGIPIQGELRNGT